MKGAGRSNSVLQGGLQHVDSGSLVINEKSANENAFFCGCASWTGALTLKNQLKT